MGMSNWHPLRLNHRRSRRHQKVYLRRLGDAINTASRMQSYSDAMRINLSSQTSSLLDKAEFKLTPRGKTEVKGKGEMEMFYLDH